MAIKRVIGIDFGTSTTVVMLKQYEDNIALKSNDFYEYIRFGGKSSVPTLIYEAEGSDEYLCGYEAENPPFKGKLYENFKMDLISESIDKRNKSYELVKKFFQYLYDTYSQQKSFFKACDEEITYVSYPAKWPEAIRELMIKITHEAGFKNVSGIDEPSAVIHTIMTQQIQKLQEKQLAFAGQIANFMIIDMGAGTTDIAICSYEFGKKDSVKELATWPTVDNKSLFGGREIDAILHKYVSDYLDSCDVGITLSDKFLIECKMWKENNVSMNLSRNEPVSTCGFIAPFFVFSFDDPKPFPSIDREVFTNIAHNYLKEFPRMINDSINATRKLHPNFTDIDFVVLTGGHSQWYFVEDIILGKLKIDDIDIDLPNIKANNGRLIKLPVPQETVALGLVLQPLSVVMKNISANNVWMKFCIGNDESPIQKVVEYGEILPFKKNISTSMRAKTSISDKYTMCVCKKYYGFNQETARCYEKQFVLSHGTVNNVIDWFDKVINGERQVYEKYDLIYDINVDVNQCTKIDGKIILNSYLNKEISFQL